MGTQNFIYTGAQQTWVVPAGITTVQMECWGAGTSAGGAKGGYAKGTISVTEGSTLYIYIGGTNGYNGGGADNGGGCGGGATDIRRGGTALSNRIIVAGGAGAYEGGHGGGLEGSVGNSSAGGGSGGGGGSQGYGYMLGFGEPGIVDDDPEYIGFGGGGGGGYYGGYSGGAGYDAGGHGGGGSSYIDGLTSASTTSGVNTGAGSILLTYSAGAPVPTIIADLVSRSTVSVAFNALLGPLYVPSVAIQSTSHVEAAFGLIAMVYINANIQSTSQCLAQLQSPPAINFNPAMASTSSVSAFIKIVLPAYLLLRGHVSIGGVPVSKASIRVLADDGDSVYTTTTNSSGDYEVEVTRDGVYHVLCYKKDEGGNIFSSLVQPFIMVGNP